MKKPKTLARAKRPALPTNDIDLRRWCIENAIRWPVDGPYGAATQFNQFPRGDVDVIGRAERLLKWVTSVSQ